MEQDNMLTFENLNIKYMEDNIGIQLETYWPIK